MGLGPAKKIGFKTWNSCWVLMLREWQCWWRETIRGMIWWPQERLCKDTCPVNRSLLGLHRIQFLGSIEPGSNGSVLIWFLIWWILVCVHVLQFFALMLLRAWTRKEGQKICRAICVLKPQSIEVALCASNWLLEHCLNACVRSDFKFLSDVLLMCS